MSELKGINNVVLLEYFDRNTDDTLILGFFSKNKLRETIDFYNTLSGFCNHTGDYIYKETFSVEGNIVYLVQIWKICDESFICKKVYESEEAAKNCLDEYCQYTNNPIYDWAIDKYIIDEKCWSEGFVTLSGTQDLQSYIDSGQ